MPRRIRPKKRSRNKITPALLIHSRYAISLIQSVCNLAGSTNLGTASRGRERTLLRRAIEQHDTAAIFDWMLEKFSYQGISDRIAAQYLTEHGSVTWSQIAASLKCEAPCPKLESYWNFHRCGFLKSKNTCSEPNHFLRCQVPRHQLRNGRLNQTAYSLFFFCRDVAGSDLVHWVDKQIRTSGNQMAEQHEALLGPLRNIFGVADKVLTMTLSALLMSAPRRYSHWRRIGAEMIVVDRLVHNFLRRTGISRRLGTDHAYGPRCYKSDGCADVIRQISTAIDARRFNKTYPRIFSRFVQHAIWRYCAQEELNVCNGNQVGDSRRCKNHTCRMYFMCDRLVLGK